MEGLGINLTLFIAQLVNFGIVFVLLVWLLRKPLSTILRERSDKIEQSLKEAAQIKEELAKIESTKKELIAEAKKQSEELVSKGQEVAAKIEKKATDDAKQTAASLLERAQQDAQTQKELLMSQLEGELKTLVKDAIASTLAELSADEQRRLIDASIETLKKSKPTHHGNG